MLPTLLISALLFAQTPLRPAEGGTVTGVITDSAGKPAAGVRVAAVTLPHAIKEGNSAAAPAAPGAMLSLAETDAQGRYTLDGISQGRYYIAAGRLDQQTYYPGTRDVTAATIVSVMPGTTMQEINFTLSDASAGRASGTVSSSQGATKPLVEIQQAPEFSLRNVLGGEVNSKELRGKVVVVEFFTTWAAPSVASIPEYNQLQKKLKNQGVEFIGVVYESGTSLQGVVLNLKQLQIEYPVVMGTAEVDQAFGGHTGYPTTFLIGKDWKVYRKILGSSPNKFPNLEADILTLLAKPTN